MNTVEAVAVLSRQSIRVNTHEYSKAVAVVVTALRDGREVLRETRDALQDVLDDVVDAAHDLHEGFVFECVYCDAEKLLDGPA